MATIISIIGILIAALTTTFEHHKNRKNLFTWTGVIIAVVGLFYGNYQTTQDEKLKNEKLNEQRHSISELKDSIVSVGRNLTLEEKINDSLKIVLHTILSQNEKLMNQSIQIQKSELEHYVQNQIALHDVTQRFGFRHLNQEAEKALTNELKKTKGLLNIQVNDAGQEGNAFCEQLIRIFHNAGWKIQKSMGIVAVGVSSGVLIGIDKEDVQVVYSASVLYNVLAIVGYQAYIKQKRVLGFDRKTKSTIPTIDIVVYPYTSKTK